MNPFVRIPKILRNNKSKIVFSHHFDDLVLSLGGLLNNLSALSCKIEDIVFFSTTNFVLPGCNFINLTTKEVSALRYSEEMAATRNFLQLKISRLGFMDAPLRKYSLSNLLHHETLRSDDVKLQQLMIKKIRSYFISTENQVFIPLAYQGHIDHLLVRDAASKILTLLGEKVKADIFFYEDLPYAANATSQSTQNIKSFMSLHTLQSLTYRIELQSKIELLKNYSSQMDERMFDCVQQRARSITAFPFSKITQERIYYLSP